MKHGIFILKWNPGSGNILMNGLLSYNHDGNSHYGIFPSKKHPHPWNILINGLHYHLHNSYTDYMAPYFERQPCPSNILINWLHVTLTFIPKPLFREANQTRKTFRNNFRGNPSSPYLNDKHHSRVSQCNLIKTGLTGHLSIWTNFQKYHKIQPIKHDHGIGSLKAYVVRWTKYLWIATPKAFKMTPGTANVDNFIKMTFILFG